MSKKKTHDIFIKEVYDLVGSEYEVIGKYNKSSEKIEFRHNCKDCENSIFKMTPNRFLSGDRCPNCRKIKRSKGFNTKNDEWFKNKIKEIVGDEYIPLTEYKGYDNEVDFLHQKCGKIYRTYPNNFFYGSRCSCENKFKSKSLIDFKNDFKLYEDTFEIDENEYINYQNKMHFKCKKCGNIDFRTPKSFFSIKNKCQKCNKINNTEELKIKIKELVKDEYLVLSEFINMNTKVDLLHQKCGKIYSVTPSHFITSGNRCKHCQNINISNGEKNIMKYLDSKEINYQYSVILKECVYVKPMEFDFIVGDTVIEFDGEQHFKQKFSHNNFDEQRKRDSFKNKWCYENGYNILRISYKYENNIENVLDKLINGTFNDHQYNVDRYWKEELNYFYMQHK